MNPSEYALKEIYVGRRKSDNGRFFFELEPTGYKPVFLGKFLDFENLPDAFKA